MQHYNVVCVVRQIIDDRGIFLSIMHRPLSTAGVWRSLASAFEGGVSFTKARTQLGLVVSSRQATWIHICETTVLHTAAFIAVLFSRGKVIRTVNDHRKVSGSQAAAGLYIVRLKYRQRPELTGVLAAILPYVCCKRVTSLVLWRRYIVLLSRPGEGFAEQRTSIYGRHLNVASHTGGI